MHRRPFFAALLFLLSFAFSGCALAQPTPTELMMMFSEPFLCGFTYDDGYGEPVTVSLLRDKTGDLLTVYGTHATTVFFHDGASLSIRTRGNEDIPPLTMPIPAAPDTGAVSSLSLVSVVPDDSGSVCRTDDGFLVTSADGSYTAAFTKDRMPIRITHNGRCAEITSFTAPPPA